MSLLVAGLVGAFIGWNFPQPEYAKKIQAWLLAKLAEFTSK